MIETVADRDRVSSLRSAMLGSTAKTCKPWMRRELLTTAIEVLGVLDAKAVLGEWYTALKREQLLYQRAAPLPMVTALSLLDEIECRIPQSQDGHTPEGKESGEDRMSRQTNEAILRKQFAAKFARLQEVHGEIVQTGIGALTVDEKQRLEEAVRELLGEGTAIELLGRAFEHRVIPRRDGIGLSQKALVIAQRNGVNSGLLTRQ